MTDEMYNIILDEIENNHVYNSEYYELLDLNDIYESNYKRFMSK